MLEVFMLIVGHDGWRKGTEPFAALKRAGLPSPTLERAALHPETTQLFAAGIVVGGLHGRLYWGLETTLPHCLPQSVLPFRRVERRVRACEMAARRFAAQIGCAIRRTRGRGRHSSIGVGEAA